MNVIDAIYLRRAVRQFTQRSVEAALTRKLIDCAIQAPTAVHEEQWAFAVIDGREKLRVSSSRAKEEFHKVAPAGLPEISRLHDPAFNIFYDSGTLIAIYGRQRGPFVDVDCCLAAENLMLAAVELGLGTCPIGLAHPWLNLEATKKELGFPATYHVVLAIIVGYPAVPAAQGERAQPEIRYY